MMLSTALGTTLAQAAEDTGGGASALTQFLPLILIVAVFYLLLIRPQQRKARQHQELVRSIGTGDRIVTIGGIHGTVVTIDEDTALVEVAPDTVITVTRGAIARRLVDADTAGGGDMVTGDDIDLTDQPDTGPDTR